MSKIEINSVYKIFGPNPSNILPMVKDGASKEEIMEVFQCVSVLGMHALTEGGPMLRELTSKR